MPASMSSPYQDIYKGHFVSCDLVDSFFSSVSSFTIAKHQPYLLLSRVQTFLKTVSISKWRLYLDQVDISTSINTPYTLIWDIAHLPGFSGPRTAQTALRTLTALPMSQRFTSRNKVNLVASNRHHATKTPPRSQSKGSSNAQLIQQRLRRPLSPHLSIYKPQITSTLSVLMRLTGLAMSGTFCLFPMIYLASPYLGIGVSAASVVASFAALPVFVKIPIKTAVAWIFTFHGFNSLRFLSWDMARGITNNRVAQTGWGVVAVSFASAVLLATQL